MTGKLQVGDRVVSNNPMYAKVGEEGYIFGFHKDSQYRTTPFVVFDRKQGHYGAGLDRPNPDNLSGWFMDPESLEVISGTPVPEPDDDDII